MIAGFTGTRRGMTLSQMARVAVMFGEHVITAVHHGAAVGADRQFHQLAIAANCTITIHPSSEHTGDPACRTGADFITTAKGALARNCDIVDASRLLIAAPRLDTEEQRSGTWATIRYARKMHRLIAIIYPSSTAWERFPAPKQTGDHP